MTVVQCRRNIRWCVRESLHDRTFAIGAER